MGSIVEPQVPKTPYLYIEQYIRHPRRRDERQADPRPPSDHLKHAVFLSLLPLRVLVAIGTRAAQSPRTVLAKTRRGDLAA